MCDDDYHRFRTNKKQLTSGVHFSGIFSKLSGLSILKHINITSVSGYDSGRNLS